MSNCVNFSIASSLRKGDWRHIYGAIQKFQQKQFTIPSTIWGNPIRPSECNTYARLFLKDYRPQPIATVIPKKIGSYSQASGDMLQAATDSAKDIVSQRPNPSDKLRELGHLAKTSYYEDLVASTMLGQGKTLYQAEIDIAELIDFCNFNAEYVDCILRTQPVNQFTMSTPDQPFLPEGAKYKEETYMNRMEYLPLNGFTVSVTPFNFTAIAGNLTMLPAVLGNPVIWKPSPRSLLSNWVLYRMMEEAGISDMVSFLPSDPQNYDSVWRHPNLACLAFTGSSKSLKSIQETIFKPGVDRRHFPRIIGETGGKNFIFLDDSADIAKAAQSAFLSAYEYNGQKCSACSQVYVPKKHLDNFIQEFKKYAQTFEKKMFGDPTEKENISILNGPLDLPTCTTISPPFFYDIHKPGQNRLYFSNEGCSGVYSHGSNACVLNIREDWDEMNGDEYFMPYIDVYPYDVNENIIDHILDLHDYALTASIFAEDKGRVKYLSNRFRFKAGNFYVNTGCTGSIVGHQPFGGAMMSGTNDKAGGPYFPLRFMNVRTVKEYVDHSR